MRALAVAVLLFIAGSMVLHSIQSGDYAVGDSGKAERNNTEAEMDYALAYNFIAANIQTQIAAQVAANNIVPITTVPNYTNGTVKATTTVEGDTTNGGAGLTAGNVDTAADERRIVLTIQITDATHGTTITHRVFMRAYDFAPFVDLTHDLATGASTDTVIPASADVSGCAGVGIGCDPNAPSAADNSTLAAQDACVLGYGSGTCPPTPDYPASTFTTKNWSAIP